MTSDKMVSPGAASDPLLSYFESQRQDDDDDDEDEDKESSSTTPSYGFEDVLEVMRDYGLTGNDLCVLLTHSSNLALRVPRTSILRKGQTDDAESLEETLERLSRDFCRPLSDSEDTMPAKWCGRVPDCWARGDRNRQSRP